MKTPLVKIKILSIYKVQNQLVLLPNRMAFATPDMHFSLEKIARDVKSMGGKLLLSDLFRNYDMQLQSHLDFKSGKKKAYSPPPGNSLHEAGRAFDLSLKHIKMPLADFWEIAKRWGVVPIISKPNKRLSESWHFECRGSHVLVYDYYKNNKANNMKPYRAMVASAILSIGVDVDKFRRRKKEAYLQFSLIRLGAEIGNVDGIIGKKTKEAMLKLDVNSFDIDSATEIVEHKLQEKFPYEFATKVIEEENMVFDYETPDHVKEEVHPEEILNANDEPIKEFQDDWL